MSKVDWPHNWMMIWLASIDSLVDAMPTIPKAYLVASLATTETMVLLAFLFMITEYLFCKWASLKLINCSRMCQWGSSQNLAISTAKVTDSYSTYRCSLFYAFSGLVIRKEEQVSIEFYFFILLFCFFQKTYLHRPSPVLFTLLCLFRSDCQQLSNLTGSFLLSLTSSGKFYSIPNVETRRTCSTSSLDSLA